MLIEKHYPGLRVQTLSYQGETAVAFSGELTALHLAELREVLREAIAGNDLHVIVDAHALEYVSINGMGLLVWLHRELRRRGGKLTLLRPSRHLREMIALTRLDRVLHIEPPEPTHHWDTRGVEEEEESLALCA